jgi:hypothetical protein
MFFGMKSISRQIEKPSASAQHQSSRNSYNVLRSSGTSPNILITFASLKSSVPVAARISARHCALQLRTSASRYSFVTSSAFTASRALPPHAAIAWSAVASSRSASGWGWAGAGWHGRFRLDRCSHYVLIESSAPKRRFPPPWPVEKTDSSFIVRDANGITLAVVHYSLWDGLGQWTFAGKHLTKDEARRIAHAIARLPEFLMQRHGFYARGSGERWKQGRPYHVALEDNCVRAHWHEIDALCKFNGIPFNGTGEKIRDGGLWHVYEFTWQLDAIQFWDRFEGRWLHKSEFHYPERPKDLPPMKPLKNWPKFDPRKARG